MKKIIKIAGNELRTLFYSPVAWLILVIFTFQVSSIFTDSLKDLATRIAVGYQIFDLNHSGFSLTAMQGYLYLYLPLLTMGLMSREFNTGSVKLLYSSPVSNTQIILGKYLAIVAYGFILVLVLITFLILGIIVMPGIEPLVVLSGILGIYLLICAYAAIGLFMSSLTSYQVVAAMGTLALFAALNFMGNVAQDIPFLRDITYWLSLAGRTNFFFFGLLCTEDILYFIIVIALFLILTIAKLNAERSSYSRLNRAGIYSSIVVLAMLLGYVSSRPVMMAYYDLTKTKRNTLTPASQAIMKNLKGGLTITTFVNIFDESNYLEALPKVVNKDMERFRHYLRFKPEIKMKYVYYYDATNYPLPASNDLSKLSEVDRAKKICETMDINFKKVLSPQQLKKLIDLSPEKFRFTRLLERDNGNKTFLRIYDDIYRHPSEREITAAFKRIAMKLPKVGFVQGDGERDINNTGDRGYYNLSGNITSRSALINQGFDVTSVNLSNEKTIPVDIDILIIADPNREFSTQEKDQLNEYMARGGNLIIAGDVGRQSLINPLVTPFGVQFMPGQLVQNNKIDLDDIIGAQITPFAVKLSRNFDDFRLYKAKLSMPGVTGLSYSVGKGFDVVPVFVSDSTKSWNELSTTNFIDSKPTIDTQKGEKESSYPTVLALSRKVKNKIQKIMILGDADCLSNSELNRSRKDFNSFNSNLVNGMFNWLSDGQVPVDINRPISKDNKFTMSLKGVTIAKIFYMGVFPFLLALTGIVIWVRRKNR